MGRNRVLGAPYEQSGVTASFTTESHVDRYLVSTPGAGPSVTVTLDPNAQDGDQVCILDAAGNAATRPITVSASPGQSIEGNASIAVNGGSATLTFSFGLGSVWTVEGGSSTANSAGVDSAYTEVTGVVCTNPTPANLLATPLEIVVPPGGATVIIQVALNMAKDGTGGSVSFAFEVNSVPVFNQSITLTANQQTGLPLFFKTGVLGAGGNFLNVTIQSTATAVTVSGMVLAILSN